MARPISRRMGGTCVHGHPLTPETASLLANGRVRCRLCGREWARQRYGHQPRHYNVLGGTCQRGHLLTRETAYRRAEGGWQCVVCHEQARRTARREGQ